MRRTPRRQFLQQAALAGGAAITVPLQSLLSAAGGGVSLADGYGPLRPANDGSTGLPLLQLPEGFRYLTFGWAGDPMDGGLRTPGLHDGMAAFDGPDGTVRLIRNHEISVGRPFDPALAYDPGAGGGTTTITFDPKAGRVIASRSSLAGTLRNCAGGVTPWNSWLTCEETLLGPGPEQPTLTKSHGYIFEVPLDGRPSLEPLTEMGRFVHEAVAVDPETSIVYETEDQRRSGLYRFIPRTPRRLSEGGRLQMLAIAGKPKLDLRTGQRAGTRYPVDWVDIAEPTRASADPIARDSAGVFTQGFDRGGAIFGRLEGAWYASGRVFVTSTDGGNARAGQVWELDIEEQELRLVFESPGVDVLNMPDNLVVSPRGGLLLCEDSKANPCMHGLTRDGKIVRFARNNVVLKGERGGLTGDFRTGEFAGATFSPDGRWLFVNMQLPAMTYAITGPWERGIL
jgi:secreted PhoX family phosphatase